ncbi:hypothetical protein AYO28_02150 [Pseudomonas putida]|uniref:Serine protease n=1 Tax=Pseudomonas putida TaxID=303 RepID=A0A177SA73_PSEPU|nr:hypothetical protein AYO28_02150 [Pseudomonas putida]
MPSASLNAITEAHPGIAQFDSLVKGYTGPAQECYPAVVEQLLELYRAKKGLPMLFEALYEYSHALSGSEHLRSLLEPWLPAGDRREAMLAKRDNFFLSRNLHSSLAEFEPKVCCIVGRYILGGQSIENQGTGFLVWPDLVLTAMHVFGDLIVADPTRVPDSFRVVFDHLKGAPISLNVPLPTDTRCVRLAEEWLVTCAHPFENDGKIDQPDPQQQEAMKEHLDFVLIRLNEKVGLQPVNPAGGRARAWIPMPDIRAPGKLARDGRLIITQHPSGQPQCTDFGRFERVCPSQTRIFYNVSTESGSSGAPCFNHDFELVGMHNAKFQPAGVAKANQAIRFDSIQARITPYIVGTELPEPARLWNLAKDRKSCRPVIGREVLLTWIEASMRVDAGLRERYFAMLPEEGQGGKSFSWEILEHCLKGNHRHLAMIFDKDRNLMPSALEDFIATLTLKFRIPAGGAVPMPARTEGDNDKIRRWASQLVPQWFCAQLEATRILTEDRRERARRMVEDSMIFGTEVHPDVRAVATQPEPDMHTEERWSLAWLVFDDLHIMTLSQEIQDFLAALTQMANSDNHTFDVLRRLRWVFLGKSPAFVDPALVCVESVGAQTYMDGIEALGRNILLAAPYARNDVIDGAISTIKNMMKALYRPSIPPAERLLILQDVAGMTLTEQLPNWMSS